MTAQEITTIEALEDIYEASTQEAVLLFKQSTTCPISTNAFMAFTRYTENKPETPAYFVKVRESRPVSNQIEADLGITHESPQIFVIKDREPLWHRSHHEITEAAIEEAMNNFA